MSKYALRVQGTPIEDAQQVLAAAEAVHGPQASDGTLSVTVDAPTLEQAVALVEAALPEHGSYTVSRPEPLEDDPDD